jgi:hypothetical protein
VLFFLDITGSGQRQPTEDERVNWIPVSRKKNGVTILSAHGLFLIVGEKCSEEIS